VKKPYLNQKYKSDNKIFQNYNIIIKKTPGSDESPLGGGIA